jgi:3-hydroxy-9,10-secoandrosta-1,3,5(10)-triene-9,17-dione monooxygenase
MPMVPFFATNLVFPALGMAKAALELFIEGAAKRGIAYTFYEKQDKAAVAHLQLGEASSKIDAAVDVLETYAASGISMTREQRARIWRDAGFAGQLIWESVNLLAGASGSSLANVGNPMSRLWLDLRVAGLHGAICTSTTMEFFRRALYGNEPNTPLL